MIDFAHVAQEIFVIMRQFNYDSTLYDASGMKTYNVDDARRFYSKAEDMGIYLLELAENSTIQMEKSDSVMITEVLGFKNTLMACASRFNLMFKMQETKGPIRPQDHAADMMQENRKMDMDLTENMYGTSRSSYLKYDNAKLIVKHSAKVDETISGARSRRIDRMYVENSRGERHLLPTRQLLAGKAMAQHINHGGELSDECGTKLCEMAADYQHLGEVIRHVRKNCELLTEDALNLRECATNGRGKIRSLFEKLHRNYLNCVPSLSNDPLYETSLEEMDKARQRVATALSCEGCQLDECVMEAMARFSFDLSKAEDHGVKDELRNPVIREFLEWAESFTVENALLAEKHDCDDLKPDEECCEDDELSREDVILPKGKTPDLKRELVKKSAKDSDQGTILMDDSE